MSRKRGSTLRKAMRETNQKMRHMLKHQLLADKKHARQMAGHPGVTMSPAQMQGEVSTFEHDSQES